MTSPPSPDAPRPDEARPEDGRSADSPAPEHAGIDQGAELLALLRGELSDDDERAWQERLDESPDLRAERDRLAADLEIWREAATGDAPEPLAETLAALLAAVRDEAAERRSRASAGEAPSSAGPPAGPSTGRVGDELGADAVALALGQLDAADTARIEGLAADDPVLRAEIEAARTLRDLTHKALAVSPRPESWDAVRSLVASEGPAPVRFDSRDIPEPRAPRRRRGGILRMVPPLVAAAAAVFLMFVLSAPPIDATVVAGAGRLAPRLLGDTDVRPVWLGNGGGSFDFVDGDVLEALTEPLTVRVACRPAAGSPRASGTTRPGTAEFVLEPGARLARVDSAHFDLLAGQVRVAAHDLGGQLELRAGDLYAAVRGTEFSVSFVEGRLVAVVHAGEVELGRRGVEADSLVLTAGEQGLVDAERLLRRSDDGRDGGAALLTPRARLAVASSRLRAGDPLALEAELTQGEGGAVTIAAFDPSVPLFLVRLKGPGGRELEVKIQDAMLASPPPTGSKDATTWRLGAETPYRLALRIEDLDLEPGRWEARLRYMSYRTSSDGAEWLGVVQSDPVTIEVTPR